MNIGMKLIESKWKIIQMENELNELNKVNEKSFAFVNVYSYNL